MISIPPFAFEKGWIFRCRPVGSWHLFESLKLMTKYQTQHISILNPKVNYSHRMKSRSYKARCMSISCACCGRHVTIVSLENASSRARVQLSTSPHLNFPSEGHLVSPLRLFHQQHFTYALSCRCYSRFRYPDWASHVRIVSLTASFPFWWCFEAY